MMKSGESLCIPNLKPKFHFTYDMSNEMYLTLVGETNNVSHLNKSQPR